MPHFRVAGAGVQLYFEKFGATAAACPRLFVLSPSNTNLKELRPYLESYTELASKFSIILFDQ